MLLGILLHASLSFFPWVWAVQDGTADADGLYDEFFHAVHGFRMPLFFLLSGFFTALLWRRRSLGYLITHRFKRIAIPLAIGMITIVPLMGWSVSWAVNNGVSDYIDEHDDIWAAVYFGNQDAVEALLDDGVDVNSRNIEGNGDSPLHVAAVVSDLEMARLLLDRGADPNAMSEDGTPLSYAVYVGDAEMAELLLVVGATDIRPPDGSWNEIEYWGLGAGEVPTSHEALGLDSWLDSFFHLWFLWFLLWLVAGFAVVAFTVDRVASDGSGPAWWSGVIMWTLIPLTIVPQLAMGEGGDIPVFGPDTSTGVIPVAHVLTYYAVFFAFGALLYGRPNRRGGQLVESIGRWWPVWLLGTLIVFPIAMFWTFESESASWLQASIGQVAYAWLAIVGLMGLFHALLSKERPGVRYLSDSSYWLYLMHLPLMIIGSSAIRNWDVPSWMKFFGLFFAVTGFLLITYQVFVRYTPIGTLLNGKRVRTPKEPAGESA